MISRNILYELGGIDPLIVARAAPKEKTKKESKNKWLKWGALAACLCLIVCGVMFAMSRTNNDASDFLIENGVLVKYTGSEKNIVIPDRVVAIADYAFQKGGNASDIETVTLGKNVKNVGVMAFDSCTSLKAVYVSEKNDLLKTEGQAVLSGDGKQLIYLNATEGMEAYAVPNGVERIGSLAFVNSGLRELILPESVTVLDSLAVIFNDSLEKVILKGVTDLSARAFYNNVALKAVELPKAMVIGEAAFAGCTSLESIALPSAVEIQKDAFSNCQSLKTLSAPNVVTIGETAFYRCASLTSLTFPKVQSIEDAAFRSCSQLSTLQIQSVQRLGEWVIAETNVSVLILPNVTGGLNEFTFAPSAVELWGAAGSYLERFAKEYGYTFVEMKEFLDLPAGFSPVNDVMYVSVDAVNVRSVPEKGDNLVGVLTKDREVLRVATDGTWSMFLYTNGEYCFISNSCLSKTPSTVTPPATTDQTYGDFSYTEKGDYVIITKYNGSAADILVPSQIGGKPVEEIASNAFALVRATVKSIDAPSVKRISGTDCFLASCHNLVSLKMPALENLPSGALFECVSLSELDLKGLKEIGSEVFVCGTFTEFYVTDATTIADDAFVKSSIKTLHGAVGSHTQAWAEANGYGFVDIANDYQPTYPEATVDASELTYTQIYHGSLANGESFAPQGVGIAHDKTGKLYLYIEDWNAYLPTAFVQFEDFASDQIHTTYQTATVCDDYAWLIAPNGSGRQTQTLSVVRLDRSGNTAYGQIDLGQVRFLQSLYLTFTDAQNGKLIVSYSEQFQKCIVYETSDGGITWKQLGTQTLTSGNQHESILAGGFATNEIGFVSYRYFGEEQPAGRTYLTVDGGITWKTWNVILPENVIGNGYGETVEMQYRDGKIILTVAVQGGSFETPQYYCYSSLDQGITWTLEAL